MSKFICAITNATSPYNMAKIAHNLGMERTSTRILERNFGKQIGKTSRTGLRAFSGKWSDGTTRIELIDKDFKRRGCSILYKNMDGTLQAVRKFMFDGGVTRETVMRKIKNLVYLGGEGPKDDIRYFHRINEHGAGIKQRIGEWSIDLPSKKINIDRNDGHILDYIIK